MNARTLIALAATGLLVLFGAMAGGCKNGGGALSLEEYFQQLDDLDAESTAKRDALDAQLEGTTGVSEAHDILEDELAVYDEFLEGLRDLNAPDEAREAHDDVIAGLDTFRDVFVDLLEEFGSASTLDEGFALFLAADTTGIDQANEACVRLEGIAADNNIEVDLDCDDEGDEPTEEPTTASTVEPSSELEDYFADLDEAENAYREQANAVTDNLSALEDTQVDEALTHIQEELDAIDGFVAALEDMDPPEEVAEMHAETIAGFQAVVALIEDNMAALESASTITEMNVVFSSEEFNAISASLDGACAALQGIAEANGIVVDLSCES